MRTPLLAILLLMLFSSPKGSRYQKPTFQVTKKAGVAYAVAQGYWSELEDDTPAGRKLLMMDKALEERDLSLRLDLYLPKNDTLSYRPLVMLMHGGSFYFGSRNDPSISQWCEYLASLGYVAASIDYRMGFLPTTTDIERAGYRAIQDAHAALRYLVANQDKYGIDTSFIFVGGCSAGAITALNLAFMTNETRPNTSYASSSSDDLGNIETSGNNLKTHFSIKGVVDMWGALSDTSMMRGRNVPILAFHGDKDDVVPYRHDYPFGKAGEFKKLLTNKMFGSSCIVDYAKKHGQKAQLYTFEGFKHSPHRDPKTKELNQNFYLIQDKMAAFFYDIIASEKAKPRSKAS
jgi:poly(3-hydroxybutyrate) depolymerase